jgi:hypothetical protein
MRLFVFDFRAYESYEIVLADDRFHAMRILMKLHGDVEENDFMLLYEGPLMSESIASIGYGHADHKIIGVNVNKSGA